MSVPRMKGLIDRVIDAALARDTIVGAVVLVRQDGDLVYERAAGYADREAGTRTTIRTVFRLASLTKPLVAATALGLVARGVWGLDDPVTAFLPEFRPVVEDGTIPTITIRHLLTHTAGFGYPEAPELPQALDAVPSGERYWAAGVSNGLDQPGLPMEEELRRIASVPLYFPPGSGWRYGLAMDVLGAAIAAARSGSLADAVAEFVTGPLSMTDTTFTLADHSRLAVAYADGAPHATRMTDPQIIQGLQFSPGRVFDARSFQSGGGGMVGTAPDFMTFLEAIRGGGAPILTPEMVRAASANQVGSLRVEDPGWGFGFLSAVLVDPQAGSTPHRPGTLSWGGVWGHQWFVDPVLGLSATICTNTAVEGCTGQFPLDVRDAIYAGRT